ncbi:PEGA domain-containing protein [Myxococcota bacterium]|nr:PEGA domain-containing protein [Myxococcota bacterium]
MSKLKLMRSFWIASLVLLAFPQAVDASKIAIVIKGDGAGSDKAAGFVAEVFEELIIKDSRYDFVSLPIAMGDPTAKRAVEAFEKAADEFEKGRNAYESFDLDPAIEYLHNALKRYERNAAYVKSTKEVADVLMLLAATHNIRGEEKTARKRLAEAVSLYPDVQPDPRIFNPTMRAAFQKVANKMAKKATGTISITSNPGYARVYIDGKFSGVAPVAVENISQGRHYVRLEKEGYHSWGTVINVVAKGEASDVANLKPLARFDEFDAIMEVAMGSIDDPARDRHLHQEVFNQVGELLGTNQLILGSVRLDGEMVTLVAAQFDMISGRRKKTATQVFSYDNDIAAYEREINDLFRAHFGETTLAQDTRYGAGGGVDGEGGLLSAGAGVCFGLPCEDFKVLSLVGGGASGGVLMLGGAISWYLAGRNHEEYLITPQTSQKATDLRSAGETQAILGDVLFGLGTTLVLVGSGIFLLYPDSPSAADVVDEVAEEEESGSWSFMGMMPWARSVLSNGNSQTGATLLWKF